MVTRPKVHGAEATAASIATFFDDDHVHLALVVAGDGRLLTTIERSDLVPLSSGSVMAAAIGTLTGRTVGPGDPLETATAILLRDGRRRLAVTGDSGELLGLLCLKKDGTGYCSDESIHDRRAARRERAPMPGQPPQGEM